MSFRMLLGAALLTIGLLLCTNAARADKELPTELKAIIEKPIYKSGTWGLRVVDLESGEVVYQLGGDRKFLMGSVRKLFSVGLALDRLGPDHRFRTPVYRRGDVDKDGVLRGDLVLVASGDLAMGGRTLPDGNLAISNFDHNEANALGNAELTKPDPLAGFDALAKQVAAAGIREITGDVIIDDRLFEPFNFRGEFDVRPIFVNDDVIDVMIEPKAAGAKAEVDWRPHSAAFGVQPNITMVAKGDEAKIELSPELPDCIGKSDCVGTVNGELPIGFEPPLTGKFPLIRTFRITAPQRYARTVFIEALARAGVKVEAPVVAMNASDKLPPRGGYDANTKVAELESPPYDQYANWILKVSYNLGADTSLVLVGLTQGARSMPAALQVERKILRKDFSIAPDKYSVIDGSGGGDSAATSGAVVDFLRRMREESFFNTYRECLPQLGVDGSLSFVTDFAKQESLAGAKGNVQAKTGTYLQGGDDGVLSLRAQALAGYLRAKSGRQLAFALFVNDVKPIQGLPDVLEVFQDQGTISAIIWREN